MAAAPYPPTRMSSTSSQYTPQSASGFTTPERTPSPSAWSTPGIPTGRRSSLGSVTTIGESVIGNDDSPTQRKSFGWYSEYSSSPLVFREPFAILDDKNCILRLREKDEEARVWMDTNWLGQLKLGKKLGEGQWSTVYSAGFDHSLSLLSRGRMFLRRESHDRKAHLFQSPETINTTESSGRKEVFAAKVGNGRLSAKILQNEARFLAFLKDRPCCKDYVVDFLGYDPERNMLVMEKLPLTLEDLVASMEILRPTERSARVNAHLRPIAHRLIDGLAYLHQAGVVHGDIKPANILLRPRKTFRIKLPHNVDENDPFAPDLTDLNRDATPPLEQLEPVYCDFSASRFDDARSLPTDSAGTYDYMAPELFARKAPDNYPTPSSDVYALGVTLLFAISGRSPYADAANPFMRRAMAMKGAPLEFARNDVDSYSRLQTAGFEAFIKPATEARASDRCTADEWKDWLDVQFNTANES